MAQNIVINGIEYQNVPKIHAVKKAGGTAVFVDTEDATVDNGNKILNTYTAYANGTKITGTIPSKSAETITPTTTDQTVSSGQYLAGAITIKGDANLESQNILNGVKIFDVTGSLTVPTINQDQQTKIVSIT